VVTLYITPIYYVYLDKLQHWFQDRKKKKHEVREEEREPMVAAD
jgi:hypothetical protein